MRCVIANVCAYVHVYFNAKHIERLQKESVRKIIFGMGVDEEDTARDISYSCLMVCGASANPFTLSRSAVLRNAGN